MLFFSYTQIAFKKLLFPAGRANAHVTVSLATEASNVRGSDAMTLDNGKGLFNLEGGTYSAILHFSPIH